MPLIATKIGWEDDPDTGAKVFIIRLKADKEKDVPDITFGDVWNSIPLKLERIT